MNLAAKCMGFIPSTFGMSRLAPAFANNNAALRFPRKIRTEQKNSKYYIGTIVKCSAKESSKKIPKPVAKCKGVFPVSSCMSIYGKLLSSISQKISSSPYRTVKIKLLQNRKYRKIIKFN
jgi:hypothetical protein